jgi:hypothetical protein
MKTRLLTALSTTALLGSAVLHAATLPVTDTFEGETPGNDLYTSPGTTTGDATWTTDDANQYPVFVDTGDGDIAIEWSKVAGTREHAFDIPPMTRGVFSADFNFIQDGDDNGNVKDAVTFRVSTASNLGAGTFLAAFIDRSARAMELNTWYNVTMVFNGDAAPLNYDTTGLTDTGLVGGLGSVGPGAVDVFLNGNLIVDENEGASGAFTYAGFVAFKSPTLPQIVQFDNFSVTEVIEDTTPRWAGYPIDESGHVDSVDWLGQWCYIRQAPWIYVYGAGYLFIQEEVAAARSGWMFAPDTAVLDAYPLSGSDYAFSFALGHWLYLPAAQSPAWFYLF